MENKYSDEIEATANFLLLQSLYAVFIKNGLKLKHYEFHKEKGIDFAFEIERREEKPITLGMFFLQNKGIETKLTPLQISNHKGKISFKLDDIRQVQYFCSELDQPLVITICDLETKSIYWEPIQLSTDYYLTKVGQIINDIETKGRKGNSIQIYFDPGKVLLKDGVLQVDNFQQFFEDIELSKEYLIKRNFQKFTNINEEEIEKIEIDRNLGIIDQIYIYLKNRFDEILMLPARFWAKSYPFKKFPQPYFYYELFCLYTDNDDVFNFFDSLIIERNSFTFSNEEYIRGVDKYSEKTKFILDTLCRNLVFKISLVRGRKEKNIRYTDDRICDCIQCSYNALKLGNVLKSLTRPSDELDVLEKQAYINYKLGNYVQSAELFLTVHSKAVEERLIVKSFIAKYNLNKLARLVPYAYSGDEPDKQLLSKLDKFNNDLDFELISIKKGKAICKWIKENRFFNDLQHVILEGHLKLRDHQTSQLYGGRSSNSHIWHVYTNHTVLESFLETNHIIFNHFSEFTQLSEIYVEAMVSSYSIHESMHSRLSHFDDWILRNLVLNANPDDIIKYCRRYFVRQIEYDRTSKTSLSFINLIENFLTENKDLTDALINTNLHENFYFLEKYTNILSNILVVASYLDLTDKEVNNLALLLKKFFEWQTIINLHRSSKYINIFIDKKGRILELPILMDFFKLGLESAFFHDEEYITSIVNCFENKKININLDGYLKKKIEDIYGTMCQTCNVEHEPTILVQFYRMVGNPSDQNFIREKITVLLNNKFNWRLYYLSAIYDILGIEAGYFDKFVDINISSNRRPTFLSHYSTDEQNRDYQLGAIINLCFKFHVDLSSEKFNHLKGFDPYYDWLLDMKNFDYSKFKPRWITEYNTVHYFDKMKNFTVIKEKIFEYLKGNHDPLLKDNFIAIYGNT